jgi:spermidine/putrescine transport system permease protein
VTAAVAAPPATRRGRVRLPRFALAAPAWLWFLAFFVVPLLFIVWFSFGTKIQGTAGEVDTSALTVDRYREATSGTFFSVLTKTLQISVVGTLLCLLVGFPIAYWIAVRAPARWKGVLLGLVIVPFWTNFLIRTMSWRIVLAPRGLVSNTLQTWGLRDTPLSILDTRAAAQMGVVYNYLPLMIFPLFVALDRLDPALREASKDLGATRSRTFVHVTLPLAAPGLVAGLLLVFIPLTGDYITARVLGGAKGNMVGALVASQFIESQNQPRGSAMAVVLIASILAVLAVTALVASALRWALARRRSISVAQVVPS